VVEKAESLVPKAEAAAKSPVVKEVVTEGETVLPKSVVSEATNLVNAAASFVEPKSFATPTEVTTL